MRVDVCLRRGLAQWADGVARNVCSVPAEDIDGTVARVLFPERSPLGAEAADASPSSLSPAKPLPLSSPTTIYTPAWPCLRVCDDRRLREQRCCGPIHAVAWCSGGGGITSRPMGSQRPLKLALAGD